MLAEAGSADAIVMAAAVADFRPAVRSDSKIKKSGAEPEPIILVREPATSSATWWRHAGVPARSIVGVRRRDRRHAGERPRQAGGKGCDLLVVNQVGNGLAFGTADNEAIGAGRGRHRGEACPAAPKDEIADAIWDLVAARLAAERPIRPAWPRADVGTGYNSARI